MCLQCLQRLEEGVRAPGTGVTADREPPGRCWEWNPGPLQQPVRLTAISPARCVYFSQVHPIVQSDSRQFPPKGSLENTFALCIYTKLVHIYVISPLHKVNTIV